MILDERLRWKGFWMLDKMKGGKIREYNDQIRYAWKEGSSIEETDKRIRDLIAHAVRTTDFYKYYPEDIALRDLPVVNKDTFRTGSGIVSEIGMIALTLQLLQSVPDFRI